MTEKFLLAGDVGATKTKFAIFSTQTGLARPLDEARLTNLDYPDFVTLTQSYLGSVEACIAGASLGIAGPVAGNRVQITNLPWVIDAEKLAAAAGFEQVWLLNDLQAWANAIPILNDGDLETVVAGEPELPGTVAIAAPGTGLGEGFLTWDGSAYQAHPTEGGHTDFGPTNPLQLELLAYMLESRAQVSYEDVCSGLGLPNIYRFLKARGYAEEPDWLRERLASAEDPNPVIVEAAQDRERESPLCRMTVEVFSDILGAEAGNLALKTLAKGGVYLGGGIPPRILPWLKDARFARAFRNKGPQEALVSRIPVKVILNGQAGLLGAAHFGLVRLERSE